MPLIRKVSKSGLSFTVTLPKSWLEEAAERLGTPVEEVEIDVGTDLIIRPRSKREGSQS